jgi:hypothetical protein
MPNTIFSKDDAIELLDIFLLMFAGDEEVRQMSTEDIETITERWPQERAMQCIEDIKSSIAQSDVFVD